MGFSTDAREFRGAYVACLDCGREFRYDWAEMRIGDRYGPAETRDA